MNDNAVGLVEITDPDEIREVLKNVCYKFKIKQVPIKIKNFKDNTLGEYKENRAIELSKWNCNIAIHEIIHHVQYCLYSGCSDVHGVSFIKAKRRVINFLNKQYGTDFNNRDFRAYQ